MEPDQPERKDARGRPHRVEPPPAGEQSHHFRRARVAKLGEGKRWSALADCFRACLSSVASFVSSAPRMPTPGAAPHFLPASSVRAAACPPSRWPSTGRRTPARPGRPRCGSWSLSCSTWPPRRFPRSSAGTSNRAVRVSPFRSLQPSWRAITSGWRVSMVRTKATSRAGRGPRRPHTFQVRTRRVVSIHSPVAPATTPFTGRPRSSARGTSRTSRDSAPAARASSSPCR